MEDREKHYEVKEHLGTLLKKFKGETKEVNLVSWNNAAPRFDIRRWSPEHKPLKGITLSEKEARLLYEILKGVFEKEAEDE